MPEISLNGRGHKSLARLALSPATMGVLRHVVGEAGVASWRQKLPHVLRALTDMGLIVLDGRKYHITPQGRAHLAELDARLPGAPGAPRARVFTPT